MEGRERPRKRQVIPDGQVAGFLSRKRHVGLVLGAARRVDVTYHQNLTSL